MGGGVQGVIFHLAGVAGGVNIPISAHIDAHMGGGAAGAVVAEEDQVAGLQIALRHGDAVFQLGGGGAVDVNSKMCVDVFTFDKCRMLYDTLPLVEYLGSEVRDVTRQMLIRMAVDAIDKHSVHMLDELYYGSALIGINEAQWSRNKLLPKRIEIV